MSYAAAAARGLGAPFRPIQTLPIPPSIPPLAVAREDCYIVHHPTNVTLAQVAVALQAQFPELVSKVQPINDKGNVLLQLHKGVDAASLVARGLDINNVMATIKPLLNSSKGSMVEARLSGLLLDPYGVETLKTKLQEYGNILAWQELCFPSTQVKTGEVHLLLDLQTGTSVPPALIKVDRESWTEEVRFSVLGKPGFCHYCRSTTHLRHQCTQAPACSSCGSQGHARYFCPSKKAEAMPAEAPATLRKRRRPMETTTPASQSTPSATTQTPAQQTTSAFSFSSPISTSNRWADMLGDDQGLPDPATMFSTPSTKNTTTSSPTKPTASGHTQPANSDMNDS
jgi:hypothetical protein